MQIRLVQLRRWVLLLFRDAEGYRGIGVPADFGRISFCIRPRHSLNFDNDVTCLAKFSYILAMENVMSRKVFFLSKIFTTSFPSQRTFITESKLLPPLHLST
jgi:hypothetical protein